MLLEFERLQLIVKLRKEGQTLGGKYRGHVVKEQFGRKSILTVPCAGD